MLTRNCLRNTCPQSMYTSQHQCIFRVYEETQAMTTSMPIWIPDCGMCCCRRIDEHHRTALHTPHHLTPQHLTPCTAPHTTSPPSSHNSTGAGSIASKLESCTWTNMNRNSNHPHSLCPPSRPHTCNFLSMFPLPVTRGTPHDMHFSVEMFERTVRDR